MKTKPSTNMDNLPISIQKLIEWIQSEKDMNPKKISELVKKAKITPQDLEPWADFEHPIEDSYGRKLIFFLPGKFEMLAMSWNPGDFSAIHDHGPNTQWGCVQVFCPENHLDHATFSLQDNKLTTVKRWYLEPGEIISVNNGLIHLMGNGGTTPYLTFHLYGNNNLDLKHKAVTVNARLFNLDKEKVELTDNGVFYVLSEEKITESYMGPSPSYHTWLRDEIELINRLDKIIEKYPNSIQWQEYNKIVCSKIMNVGRWKQLKDELLENIDVKSGKVKNYRYWNNLRTELKVAECKQCLMQLTSGDIRKISEDKFDTYANVYDEIVGKPCLENFVKNYIKFIEEKFGIDFAKSEILSIGCGTGLTEKYIIDTYNIPKNNLLGVDISDSMVKIAARRINAKKADITRLALESKYDVVFSGLNVLQYINSDDFRNAILNAGKVTKSKGVFFGDFIAPDHIRWYPNVLITENVISLREPSLIEVNNHSYQSSEIINLNKLNNTIQISYEGIHKRYLPPIMRVYSIFKEAFGGEVQIFDAISLEKIKKNEDTCPSTRYLVVAQKS